MKKKKIPVTIYKDTNQFDSRPERVGFLSKEDTSSVSCDKEIDDCLEEKPPVFPYDKNKKVFNNENMYRYTPEEKKKVVFLWVGVTISMVIIITGWLASLRYSDFFRINTTADAGTMDEIQVNARESYEEFNKNLELLKTSLDDLKALSAEIADSEVNMDSSIDSESSTNSDKSVSDVKNDEKILNESGDGLIVPKEGTLPAQGLEVIAE